MKAYLESGRMILEFDCIELEAIRGCFAIQVPETPSIQAMVPKSSAPRVILTDARIAEIESRRVQEKILQRNEEEMQNKLQAGVLPFREQERPPGVPLKTSPRLEARKTGQFAGEQPIKGTEPQKVRDKGPEQCSGRSGAGLMRIGRNPRRVPTNNTNGI